MLTQVGSTMGGSERFFRNIISDVTSVPADLKALFGNLIAPTKSALFANSLRNELSFLSSVPLEVTKAMIPPSRTLSSDFKKK